MNKLMAVFAVFAGLAFLRAIIFAVPTMYLWNWLITSLFSLPKIGLMEAMGIITLSWLIFPSTTVSSKN